MRFALLCYSLAQTFHFIVWYSQQESVNNASYFHEKHYLKKRKEKLFIELGLLHWHKYVSFMGGNLSTTHSMISFKKYHMQLKVAIIHYIIFFL